MITIRALLNRIRWDSEFGRGDFAVGYFDRIEEKIKVVSLEEVHLDPDHFSFSLDNANGESLAIPLHRVCEVYRNGEIIWQREKCLNSHGKES
jgi:uncharacterized protein (UPF0248 family)